MANTNHSGALAAAAGALGAVGLLVLIIMPVVVEAWPVEATFAGSPGKIAYEGFDGNDWEIYIKVR